MSHPQTSTADLAFVDVCATVSLTGTDQRALVGLAMVRKR